MVLIGLETTPLEKFSFRVRDSLYQKEPYEVLSTYHPDVATLYSAFRVDYEIRELGGFSGLFERDTCQVLQFALLWFRKAHLAKHYVLLLAAMNSVANEIERTGGLTLEYLKRYEELDEAYADLAGIEPLLESSFERLDPVLYEKL